MVEQAEGVIVNARMIGIQSKVVVASAQAFIPAWVIGDDYTQQQNVNNHVKIKNGMLIRNRVMLSDDDRTVKIKK
jgi:hypothetical protein